MRSLTLLLFAVAALSAQSFESVSVERFVQSDDDSRPEPVPGSLMYNDVSLKMLVAAAYGVRQDLISGPGWLDGERYDVIARPPAGATKEQVPAMLQNLLTDRFKVVVHIEDRPRTSYALVLGKDEPKLEPTKVITGGDFSVAKDHIDIVGLRIPAFAGLLSTLIGRPVADETGIQGIYHIQLRTTLEDLKAAAPSVFTAIHDLGLVLETRTTTVKYAVVDRNQLQLVEPERNTVR